MEGDPSIYYLWLRENCDEPCVTLSTPVTPYLQPLCGDVADEDDLTASA